MLYGWNSAWYDLHRIPPHKSKRCVNSCKCPRISRNKIRLRRGHRDARLTIANAVGGEQSYRPSQLHANSSSRPLRLRAPRNISVSVKMYVYGFSIISDPTYLAKINSVMDIAHQRYRLRSQAASHLVSFFANELTAFDISCLAIRAAYNTFHQYGSRNLVQHMIQLARSTAILRLGRN